MTPPTVWKSIHPTAVPLPILRPMEIGELLDEAFDLYKRNFRLLIGIYVLVNAPVGLLLGVTSEGSVGRILANLLSGLAGVVSVCALAQAAMDRVLGRETTIAASYRIGLRRFWKFFGAAIVYTLAAMGGFLLLIVPGLIVSLWSLLLVPVVVVENRGFGALQRIRQLAAGNLWRLVLLMLCFFAVGMVFGIVLVSLMGLVVALTGTDPSAPTDGGGPTTLLITAGVMVVLTLIQAAWMPLLTTAEVLTYLDLRIRREAYDLELLANTVEARVEATRSAAPAGGPAPGPITG